jgi:hypothetical protein
MTLRILILVAALIVPTVAKAEPISVGGMWSPASTLPSGDSTLELGLLPFWSGVSWDGWDKGVAFLLEDYGATNLEYLHNGAGSYTPFRFEEDIFNFEKIGGITAWTQGILGRRADGAFTYDSGPGSANFTSNSWDSPGQFALFRIVLPEVTHYFLGVEDILLSQVLNDHDYNDYIVKFDTPQAVPEPGTLLLLGAGMAALAARKRLAGRKVRGAATV